MDSTAAPPGKDAIMVLCPVGHINTKVPQDWDKLLSKAREFIIKTLSERLEIPDFKYLIDSEEVNTPMVWQEKFGLWNGSALGLSHNIFQVCWFRPSPSHNRYSNVYFVGASTQPGTGVPIGKVY